ncbi:hypothetical protein BDQ12DRAFT_717331 [Crucibulum laeve]|uniref:DUF6535 domain-containing protein n=1 Tax=Crucibulum laeve TaxID=68775 RepID=A0A5C3MFL4_9AGAR|nr:hypothetical protein BDQ12DRAFT_717331 [Crucibulum laeve]
MNEKSEFVPWRSGDPFRYPISKDGDPWKTCYKAVKEYNDAMCTAWKDEVQNLLIFAGLFSAVVTAFVVESYKMLTDPIDDSTRLLAQIAAELASINGRNATTTTPPPQENFSPSALAVRLNTFWFLSLTLSLATVLVGILALQWIREYERYETTSYKERLEIRQMRYKAIVKWQVPNIIWGLPVLLQSALILFFLGMLDLLRSLDSIVAVILSIVVGLVFLVIVATTMIPGIQLLFMCSLLNILDVHPQSWSFCPYKSPQSWAFYQLVKLLSSWTHVRFKGSTVGSRSGGWFALDDVWNRLGTYKHLPNAIAWAGRTFGQGNDSIPSAIYHCINDMPPSTAMYTVALLSGFDVKTENPIKNNALYTEIASARCLRYFRTYRQRLSVHEMELFVRIWNSKTQNADDEFSDMDLLRVLKAYAKDSTIYPSELMVQVTHTLATIFESRGEYSLTELNFTGGFVWYGIVASDTINSVLHIPLAKLYGALYQWICQPQLESANFDKSRDLRPHPQYSFFCGIMDNIWMVPFPRVPPNLDGYFRSQQHCEMLRALEVLFRSAFAKYSKKYFFEHNWSVDNWSAFRDKILVTLPGVLDNLEDTVINTDSSNP